MRDRNTWGAVALAISILPVLFLFNNCQNKETSTMSRDSDSGNGNNGNNTNRIIESSESKLFFENTILPTMDISCKRCHDEPRFGGNATIRIWDFNYMASLLGTGDSATENLLMDKIQNIIPHEGGNNCAGGIISTPCKEFIQWRLVTLPDSDVGGGFGAVTYMSLTGDVSGWAMDAANTETELSVEIYYNGPKGTGTSGGTFDANLSGIGGTYGGHYFRFLLPENVRDGQERELYVYASIDGVDTLLSGMPKKYTAYTPKAESEFTQEVFSRITCVGCHVWTYETAYAGLISPAPHKGGTKTKNRFIEYAQGLNGHPGGNACNGGINSGLCAAVQDWWDSEFNSN